MPESWNSQVENIISKLLHSDHLYTLHYKGIRHHPHSKQINETLSSRVIRWFLFYKTPHHAVNLTGTIIGYKGNQESDDIDNILKNKHYRNAWCWLFLVRLISWFEFHDSVMLKEEWFSVGFILKTRLPGMLMSNCLQGSYFSLFALMVFIDFVISMPQ